MRRKKIKQNFLKSLNCNKLILISALCLFLFFGFNFFAQAQSESASLYLTPSAGTYAIDSTFSVKVRVNTGGQVINAAEGVINFDNSLLEVKNISTSGSIFHYWTTQPSFSNSSGVISFGGGLPPPAFSGDTGHICSISFKAKKLGRAQIRFSSGAVLAHDGKGTNILDSIGSGSYIIAPSTIADDYLSEDGEEEFSDTQEEDPGYNQPIIESPTHPNQNFWYNENKIQFKWKLPDEITGVSVDFNKEPNSDPGPTSDGLFSEKEYENIEDGVWYLHLKFKDNKQWGDIAHFRVMIDTTSPMSFEFEVRYIDVGDWPEFYFETGDSGSGIKQYEIIIGSLELNAHVVDGQNNSFKVDNLEPGEHTAIIKAVDQAGNITYSEKVKFNIDPVDAPIITNYAHELKSSDQFFMSGTTLPNSIVNIFIQDGENLIIKKTINSDNSNWFYVNQEQKLENGRYVAWVESTNSKGLKSGPSNKISFLVTPPVFTSIGFFVVNYFTVFVSLIFMIILIVVLALYISGTIRKRLKKETVEVREVLESNLDNLSKEIDQELVYLNKFKTISDIKNGRVVVQTRLKKNIEITKKKILKEIRDVEEILK